jgi:hypothetical protein
MMYGQSNGSTTGNVPFNNGQCANNTFQTPYNPTAVSTPMQQQQQQQQFATPQQPQQQQQQQGMWQQQPGYDPSRFYNNYNGTMNSVGAFSSNTQYGANSGSVNASMPQWNPQAWNSWQQQQQQQQTAMPQQQQPQLPAAMPQQQQLQQPTVMPLQQQQPQQQAQQQQVGNMNGVAATAGAAAVPKRCDAYQRTFDYVQQCQNWTAQQ